MPDVVFVGAVNIVNILDKGEKHLRIRKKNGEDEIYWILCLEPGDYAEFIDDCLIIYCPDAGEEVILKHFKSLGFDIRMKPLEKNSVEDEEPEKEVREIQSIIA